MARGREPFPFAANDLPSEPGFCGVGLMNMPSALEPNPVREPVNPQQTLPGMPVEPEQKHRSRWWLWLLILGVLGYGGYRGWQFVQSSKPAASPSQAGRKAPRPTPVVAVPARTGDLPIYLRGLGSVSPFNTVTVRSRVDGQIMNVAFSEGQLVHEGDLLLEIDPRPFQVQLEQAQGQQSRDRAQLNDAKVNLDRYKALYDAKVIPKQQLDTQQSSVKQFEGAIEADQAGIDSAKLQLSYCRITAPLTGRVGFRLADQGNIIHASDPNGLLVITQLQPISVLFTIPQDNLQPVLKKLRAGAKLPVVAFDRDNVTKLATGTLVTVDNQIDQTTGTSKLKAVFDNSDFALFPNQFVNVQLLLDTERNVVIVPSAAVQRGPQGTFVYLVEDTNGQKKVSVRPVTTGNSEGNRVVVSDGLAAGNVVVVDGGDKLVDGSLVDVSAPKRQVTGTEANKAPGASSGADNTPGSVHESAGVLRPPAGTQPVAGPGQRHGARRPGP
jgi:membrane fusion protein, multidrug efflux system